MKKFSTGTTQDPYVALWGRHASPSKAYNPPSGAETGHLSIPPCMLRTSSPHKTPVVLGRRVARRQHPGPLRTSRDPWRGSTEVDSRQPSTAKPSGGAQRLTARAAAPSAAVAALGAQRGTPPARHPGKLSAWQALPEHPANILPRHRSIGMSDKDRWLFGRMRQKAAYFFHV